MGIQLLEGAQGALAASGAFAPGGPLYNIIENSPALEAVAQQMVARARTDQAVVGGQTGVPAMQQPTSYSIDTQYGVRLPDALVQTFMTDTPLLQRILSLGNTTRPERAAVYGLLDAMSFSAGQYGDFVIGSDPPGIRGTRSYGSEVKKSYGAMASITDVDAIASGAQGYPTRYGADSYVDDRELLLRYCTIKTLTALEYSIVKGNSSSRPTQFDGFETKMTYDATLRPFVRDLSGATTGALTAINNMILAMASKGVRVTELWMHPLTKQAITNEYLGLSGRTINISQGNDAMRLGQQVSSIVTPIGTLPIYESYHFTLAGSSPNLSGDIFLISSNKDGIPLINFEWMVQPRALDLARVPGFYTSQVMGVWCHGVLYERSGWWAQGRIKNYGFSFDTSAYPVATMVP